jgi:hypothetical protein
MPAGTPVAQGLLALCPRPEHLAHTGVSSLKDEALWSCSAMQNLREAIAGYRQRLMREGHEGKRNSLLEVTSSAIAQYTSTVLVAALAWAIPHHSSSTHVKRLLSTRMCAMPGVPGVSGAVFHAHCVHYILVGCQLRTRDATPLHLWQVAGRAPGTAKVGRKEWCIICCFARAWGRIAAWYGRM